MEADLIIKNGKIHTIDKDDRIAEAVAVSGEKLIYVGGNEGVKPYIGANTKVIDAEGNLVLPGFFETHVHIPGSAFNVLFNIDLFDAKNEQETMETIRLFLQKNPDREIYYGRGFMSAVFPGLESSLGPKKERLDALCPDKPMILSDYGGHVHWLNSKAIEMCGITKDMSDPPGGVIERDPVTGEIWGILKEEAKALFPDQQFSMEDKLKAIRWWMNKYNAYGYTSVFGLRPSAVSYPSTLFEPLSIIEERGGLTLRVQGAREIKPSLPFEPQIRELIEYRKTYHSKLLKATTAKYFIDGAVEGVSAYLSQPYETAAGKGTDYYGESLWKLDRLTDAFIRTLKENFRIHVHAIGDEAVSLTLDALEIAQKEVPGDHRNIITHIQLIKPEDVQRMKKLNIVANLQVFWHFKDPCVYFQGEKLVLGDERAEREYPLKVFLDNGVCVSASSDHPITPDPNPFYAIEAGVTRNLYYAKFFKVEDISHMDDPRYLLDKEERVSVLDMVKSYTINSAWSLHMEQETGSIEVGKYADMIIIDRDIFHIDPIDIEFTKVLKTIFGGEVIFSS